MNKKEIQKRVDELRYYLIEEIKKELLKTPEKKIKVNDLCIYENESDRNYPTYIESVFLKDDMVFVDFYDDIEDYHGSEEIELYTMNDIYEIIFSLDI